MKHSLLLILVLTLVSAVGAQAQDAAAAEDNAPVQRNMEILDYGDYTVKAYSISFFGGQLSGSTFLDLEPLGDKTRITESGRPDELWPNDILGYDGSPLMEGRLKRDDGLRYLYDSGRKEVKSGPSFGGRVGIFIADDFHLDLYGAYAKGKAVTSMVYQGRDDTDPLRGTRMVVDEDDGFSVLRGGLSLMYDARPATFFSIVPRVGFGLGGVINSYTHLEDKTGLYLEGSLGLTSHIASSLDIFGQIDLDMYSMDIEELGYSEMVNYTTFSLGLTWFIDVLPPQVRAAHIASKEAE